MDHPVLGHNTNDEVFCGLCKWHRKIDTYEQAEHFLKDHLANVHGKKLVYSTDVESGERKDVPQ